MAERYSAFGHIDQTVIGVGARPKPEWAEQCRVHDRNFNSRAVAKCRSKSR